AVGVNGVATEHVGVSDAFAAINFGTVVHAAGLGPAFLGDGRHVAVQFENERAGIVAFGLIGVDVSAHVGVDALHATFATFGSTQEPAKELDRMAAHVHGNAPAAALDVPKPT